MLLMLSKPVVVMVENKLLNISKIMFRLHTRDNRLFFSRKKLTGDEMIIIMMI